LIASCSLPISNRHSKEERPKELLQLVNLPQPDQFQPVGLPQPADPLNPPQDKKANRKLNSRDS